MTVQTTFVNGISPFGPRIEPRTYYARDDVLEHIRQNPGRNADQIAASMQRTKDVIQRHLRNLLYLKLIRRQRVKPGREISSRTVPYLHWAVQ